MFVRPFTLPIFTYDMELILSVAFKYYSILRICPKQWTLQITKWEFALWPQKCTVVRNTDKIKTNIGLCLSTKDALFCYAIIVILLLCYYYIKSGKKTPPFFTQEGNLPPPERMTWLKRNLIGREGFGEIWLSAIIQLGGPIIQLLGVWVHGEVVPHPHPHSHPFFFLRQPCHGHHLVANYNSDITMSHWLDNVDFNMLWNITSATLFMSVKLPKQKVGRNQYGNTHRFCMLFMDLTPDNCLYNLYVLVSMARKKWGC